jgi:hypothetical protein
MRTPTGAATIANRRPPPITRLRFLFAINEWRSVLAMDKMRRLLAVNRLLSLFAISGMRGLFGPLDSCGFRVSKSGISFSSIRLWVALGAYIGAEVDESTMNPVDRPRAAPPPMGLPISDSPISPFHFVQTMVEAGC